MFGRHPRRGSGEDQELAVNVDLENDLASAEQAVATYLQNPSDELRQALLASLQRLDDQIDLSDAYDARAINPVFGSPTKGTVVGETGPNSVAEDVPSVEFQAQVVLVKAAKKEATGPTAGTLAELRAASASLAAVRAGEASGAPQA
jgi:hypothetical protein